MAAEHVISLQQYQWAQIGGVVSIWRIIAFKFRRSRLIIHFALCVYGVRARLSRVGE